MTAGGTLEKFCNDLKLGELGKKKIKIDKMKTYELAKINKDEIM